MGRASRKPRSRASTPSSTNGVAPTKSQTPSSKSQTPTPRAWNLGFGIWGLGFTLKGLGFSLYANAVSAPFVFDDDHAIVVNEQIRHVSTSLSPTEQGSPLAGRPLVSLTFAINSALGGLDPRGYRIVNVALHAINALLLFAVAARTLRV